MKMLATVIFVASAAILGFALSFALPTHHAGARSHTTVDVTLKDYKITVSERRLPAGEPITFVITNRGRQTHEFVLEPENAFDKAMKFDGKTYEADQIKPGTTRKVTWTIPHEGSYKLACHIDHHYQKGMKAFVTAIRASA